MCTISVPIQGAIMVARGRSGPLHTRQPAYSTFTLLIIHTHIVGILEIHPSVIFILGVVLIFRFILFLRRSLLPHLAPIWSLRGKAENLASTSLQDGATTQSGIILMKPPNHPQPIYFDVRCPPPPQGISGGCLKIVLKVSWECLETV